MMVQAKLSGRRRAINEVILKTNAKVTLQSPNSHKLEALHGVETGKYWDD